MKEFKGTNTDQGWNLHRDEEGDLYVIAGHEDFFGGYTPVFKCEQHGELGEADAKLAASAPELLDALQWALPLARLAMDSHRMERIKCGHTDITGTYSNGETWVGIYQSEVDEIEFAQNTIKKALGE